MSELLSVLLVEDDPLILEDMAETLRENGCLVRPATSYDEALRAIDDVPVVAVLVTDIALGGYRSGLDLVEAARQRKPELGVIILSGQVRPPSDSFPADALFCTKPCAPGALVELVKACRDWVESRPAAAA
jgi:DNA-binding NtrC family response regulator